MAKVLTIPGIQSARVIPPALTERRTKPVKAGWSARKKDRSQNKLEAAYDAHLQFLQSTGVVSDFRFEAVKLRLADNTFYTPDFIVFMANGEIEFHETKGFWAEHNRVKIKVVAEVFPWFTFRAYQRIKGEWIEENF